MTNSYYKKRNRLVAVSGVSAFYVCRPIIFNLFILIILNLVTVSFHFYLAFAAPDEGEFCLTEILGNKITLLSCPISLAIGFFVLFNIGDPDLHQDPASPHYCCPSGPCIKLSRLIRSVVMDYNQLPLILSTRIELR